MIDNPNSNYINYSDNLMVIIYYSNMKDEYI